MKWGNAGHLTKALFAQDKIWVNAKSEVVRISDMKTDHVLNTLLMLERMDDLPFSSRELHGTKLYAALYDRLLGALAPNVQAPTPVETTSLWPFDTTTTYGRRVGVGHETIVSILNAAIQGASNVLIDYESAVGGVVTTNRRIAPLRIEERGGRMGFPEKYLHAIDIDKGEPRVFLVRNIKRCEDA